MKLHVVYRTSASENAKARPPFYDKRLALYSLLRAARSVEGVELVFLTDGDMPGDRLELMARHGEVMPLRRGTVTPSYDGFVASYRAAVGVAQERGWPHDDLVYLVEDDYLHRPESLAALVEAAADIRRASYFALYGAILYHDSMCHWAGDGRMWMRAYATTCTFAARVGTLADDRWIHRLGVYLAGVDTQIARTYRGVQPVRVLDVLAQIRGEVGDAAPLGWRLKLGAIQTAMKLLALRRAFRPHYLVAPADVLAVHMEDPFLGTGAAAVDWEAVAEETRSWAALEFGIRPGRPEGVASR